jgi:hypothetical protein
VSRLKELRKSILFGVYVSLSLIFILPIWVTEFFITLEGPLVNYFGDFINDIVFTGSSWYSIQYKILGLNYTGSFSLILQLLKGSLISTLYFDKIIASTWIVLVLYFSRIIILGINSKADYRPFLIFPFIFCLPFFQGDWNFLGGVIAMLWFIKILSTLQYESIKKINFVILLLLCLLIASISSLSIYIFIVILGFSFFFFNPNPIIKKENFLLFLIPSILISVLIVTLNKGIYKNLEFIPLSLPSRAKDLIYFETLVSFEGEANYALILLALVFVGLFIFSFISIFYRLKPDRNQRFWHQMLFVASFISLLLYFILPNSNYSVVTNHLHWMFLSATFLILSLACLRLKKSWMITLALFSIIISVAHLRPQFLNWNQFSQNKKIINQFADFIPNNSAVSVFLEDANFPDNLVFELAQKKQIIIEFNDNQSFKEYQYYSGIKIGASTEKHKLTSQYVLFIGKSFYRSRNIPTLKLVHENEHLQGRLYKKIKPVI